MKTYFSDIIPRIKRFSQELDNLTLLTNQHWVVIDELENSKFVYIFRNNSELLISQNGKVEKGKWEYLGNNSLLIERKEECFLFRHGFFDSNILALKVDGRDEYAFLVNENNYGGDLNSIEKVLNFLETKYISLINSNVNGTNKKIEKECSSDDQLIVSKNEYGKYGYLNIDEEMVIDFLYDGAYDFIEGFARVYKTINNQDFYGFIDKAGFEIVPLKYEFASCFSEGFASVRLNKKFGYIDCSNKIVIDFQFYDANSFNGGRAKVGNGSNYFYINKSGERI